MPKSIYKVTEEFINNNPTFIIEKDENIIGFYSILINENEASLEYFYIEPKYIGKGYGRILWNHMVQNCKNLGIKEIEIVTSPEAKVFYMKMGAVQTCEIKSLVNKERKIPQLIYTIEK
ncbi:GNAT family N-acetyltransferase [Oceanirhabdus seepicola]|uniref:GNAT family N-acetyltransferase n=1 Tax=Oceanirhabdus seepicola TaxID=2828781 RepID=A0A9J6P482_9CLOT|nr:GNAT family N-acetyltransferase [Oceanirhabdus seepicola]MCM1991519.1 GNAT family N-acetyltransferase [Oceanirhabdus seepicola]